MTSGQIRIKTGCTSCLKIMWLDPFDVDGVDGIHTCYDSRLMVQSGDMEQQEYDERHEEIERLRRDFVKAKDLLAALND